MTIAAVAFIDRTASSSSGVSSKPVGAVGASPFGPVPRTVFSLSAAKGRDDQGRATYYLANETYGFVQYDPDDRTVFVQEVDSERGYRVVGQELVPRACFQLY